VFDMRFLPNPFYIEELREFSGKDDKVRDYVLSFEQARLFINKILDMISLVSPHYLDQDKKQIVIAIGCTGGMHRSVVVAEEIYRVLKEKGERVTLDHRDIGLG